jgi:hypothetical protein
MGRELRNRWQHRHGSFYDDIHRRWEIRYDGGGEEDASAGKSDGIVAQSFLERQFFDVTHGLSR